MVALEGAAGDAELLGEGVELVVALVADQVGPDAIAPGPDRGVDEDRQVSQESPCLALAVALAGASSARSGHQGGGNTVRSSLMPSA